MMRSISKTTMAIALIFMVFTASAELVTKQTTAVGIGPSKSEAIHDGLLQAAGQAFGFNGNENAQFSLGLKNTEGTLGIVAALNTTMSLLTNIPQNNPITGYELLDAKQMDDGKWQASVTLFYAEIEGLDPDSNRPSVVVNFGAEIDGQKLENIIENILVDSKNFDVLERDNAAIFDEERFFIESGDAGRDQIARVGKAIGADYLITGNIYPPSGFANREYKIVASNETRYNTSLKIKYSYKILEFSSRKIIASESNAFSFSERSKKPIGAQNVTDGMLKDIADEIVTKTFALILPDEPLSVSSPVSNTDADSKSTPKKSSKQKSKETIQAKKHKFLN